MPDKEQKEELRAKTTIPFKLKPKAGKQFQIISMKSQFGFMPDTIIVERLIGQKNMFVVRAIMTPEEIKKENKLKAELKGGDENE